MGYSGADVARFLGITTSGVNRLAASDLLSDTEKYHSVVLEPTSPSIGAYQGDAVLSLQSLHEEWAVHRQGKNRARGGRDALGGFIYQLYLSLDRFFSQVVEGNRDAQFSFEGLSDLAELQ